MLSQNRSCEGMKAMLRSLDFVLGSVGSIWRVLSKVVTELISLSVLESSLLDLGGECAGKRLPGTPTLGRKTWQES